MIATAGLLLATMDPSKLVQSVGSAFWAFVLIIGMAKCVQISLRPTASSKSAIALMLVLGAWLLGCLFAGLSRFWPPHPLVAALVAVLSLMLLCSAITLAILGLVDGRRRPELVQGRSQAVWAIVLAVIFLLLLVAGGVHQLSQTLGAASRAQQTPAQGTYSFEDLNFQYQAPGRPWMKVQAELINPDASLVLARTRPPASFFIIAERIGEGVITDVSALVETAKVHLHSQSPHVKIWKEEPYRVKQMDGIWMESTATIGFETMRFVHWLYLTNGYCYQLILAGREQEGQKVVADARWMLPFFRQIDPQRVAITDASTPFGRFKSETFGYTMDLSGTSWRSWRTFQTENPEADSGGLMMHRDEGFLMVPFVHGRDDGSAEALVAAYMSQVGITAPEKAIRSIRNGVEQGVKTRQFEFRQEVRAKTFFCSAKLWMATNVSFFLWRWADAKTPEAELREGAELLFGSVRFDPSVWPKLDPLRLNAREREQHAYLFDQVGQYYLKTKDYPRALTAFQQAFALEPEGVLYLSHSQSAYSLMKDYAKALAYLDAAPAGCQTNFDLRAWRAWHTLQLGRRDEAQQLYQALFADGFQGLEDLGIYGNLLAEQKDWPEFDRTFARWTPKDPKVLLAQADILAKHEKNKEAVALLKREKEQSSGLNPDLEFELMRNYDALEQYGESLGLCDNLISNGYSSAEVYYRKAVAECGLRWYQRAKSSLELALQDAPNNKEISDYLAYVSGMLGEGDNSSIKEHIAPVSIPEAVAERLPALTAEPPQSEYGAFIISDLNGIVFERGRERRSTRYLRVKVLDAGGVSRYSTMEINFDPLSEKIFVNSLVVRDGEGEVIQTGKPSDYYVLNKTPNDEMLTHDKTLCLPIANLMPGHTIELAVSKETLTDAKEFDFRRLYLATDRPALLMGAYYLGDARDLKYSALNKVQTRALDKGLFWWIENPLVFKPEGYQPELESFFPMLLLADGSMDWKKEAEKYLESMADRLKMSPAIEAQAEKLVQGRKSREDQIRAVLEHVQTDYTYKPIEFGIRGTMPYPAEETIRNRYGDCKDHAVLAHQLLKALDIPSQLVLICSRNRLDRELPTLDQFDHMILYIPDKQGCRFVDLTQKGLDLMRSVPAGLAQREALILEPGRPRFETVPDYRPEDGIIREEAELRVEPDLSLKVRDVLTLSGYYASSMRDYLKGMDASLHSQWMQSLLQRYVSFAELTSFKVVNLRDNSKDLVLESEYQRMGGGRAEGKDLTVQIATPWLSHYFQLQPLSRRTEAFFLEYPCQYNGSLRLVVPEEFTVVPSDRKDGATSDSGSWAGRLESGKKGVEVSLSSRTISGRYEPGEYERYRRTMDGAIRFAAEEVRLRK